MTSRDFCYWLQGFMELRASTPTLEMGLDGNQTHLIRRHLSLVFAHEIDPSMGAADMQAKLDALHQGKHAQGSGGFSGQDQAKVPAQGLATWAQGVRPDGTQVRC